jgi:nitroreductase
MATAITPDTILQQLSWRYATKKFDATKKIPESTWATIERAMILAPSSFGLQPYRFLHIRTPEIRQQLRAVSWNQPQVTDASHFIVLASKTGIDVPYVQAYIRNIADVRGIQESSLKGFHDMMVNSMANPSSVPGGSMHTYTRSQTYIALGFGLFTAALLGVDACPMEGFDAAKYDEILDLPSKGLHASVIAAFGYRAPDDPIAAMKKVRLPEKDAVIRV